MTQVRTFNRLTSVVVMVALVAVTVVAVGCVAVGTSVAGGALAGSSACAVDTHGPLGTVVIAASSTVIAKAMVAIHSGEFSLSPCEAK